MFLVGMGGAPRRLAMEVVVDSFGYKFECCPAMRPEGGNRGYDGVNFSYGQLPVWAFQTADAGLCAIYMGGWFTEAAQGARQRQCLLRWL